MIYVYPAIFTPDTSCGYSIDFPDIPGCVTDGKDLVEAMEMAEDALASCLCVYEDEGIEIPKISDAKVLEEQNPESFIALIKADTLQYRAETDNRAVRKNVSVPAWLCTKAERANINFSQMLQEALKERLNIQ